MIARPPRAVALLGAVTCAALLAACTSSSADPTPMAPSSATTTTTTTSKPPTATPAPDAPPSAAAVRGGLALRADGARAWVLAADGVQVTKHRADDGSIRLTFRDSRTAADAPLAYVTGADPETFGDGTALVGRGGLTPSHGRLSDDGADVLALTARGGEGTTTLWFAGSTVAHTSWGNREGGESLAVTPTAWARNGGLAAQRLTWDQLVAAEPDADSQTMHDQLTCHELGAPDKATWNLEPWRPQVDGLAMIAARCNPT
ncbi:DUF2599 domain-containing protein [Cellulomonas edaphi]|uniref:DUF2599 domain-containing protein n=1 Tax=Cellulomonas edaphi TaxID=3053468 RepID=A0ABT7S257_9CELL|nr:DUF2599 domain-containing protein [Cellulomons edaphi]MDM7829703.1 DUF2599 domain-containing protein [Cellulomons edaphi]